MDAGRTSRHIQHGQPSGFGRFARIRISVLARPAWLTGSRSAKAMEEDSPCPACGFLVFNGPPGSYEICPVCDWEDDHVQLAHPLMRGGANRKSLAEAQVAILKTIPLTVRVHGEFKREEGWRPLTNEEVAVRSDVPRDGRSYFEATSEEPGYYWRTDEKK